MEPDKQTLIGKLATIPTAFVMLFMAGDVTSLITAVALLAIYAFLLSRNLLNASLVILSFITVFMVARSFGYPLPIAFALLSLLALYQGIIGICRMKSQQINIKQQAIIWFWIASAFIMGICPPWSVIQSDGTYATRYGLLWFPPSPDFLVCDGVGLKPGILSIQWLIITTLSCTLVCVLGNKNRHN